MGTHWTHTSWVTTPTSRSVEELRSRDTPQSCRTCRFDYKDLGSTYLLDVTGLHWQDWDKHTSYLYVGGTEGSLERPRP